MVGCQVDVSETEAKEIRVVQHVHTCYVFLCNYDNYEMDRWKMFNRGAVFFFSDSWQENAGRWAGREKKEKSKEQACRTLDTLLVEFMEFSAHKTACSFSLAMEDNCV